MANAISMVTAKAPSPPSSISVPQTISAEDTTEIGFSPHGGITSMIVRELNDAQKSIAVQAYSFTNAEIAKALVDAFKRGLEVRVILTDNY